MVFIIIHYTIWDSGCPGWLADNNIVIFSLFLSCTMLVFPGNHSHNVYSQERFSPTLSSFLTFCRPHPVWAANKISVPVTSLHRPSRLYLGSPSLTVAGSWLTGRERTYSQHQDRQDQTRERTPSIIALIVLLLEKYYNIIFQWYIIFSVM